ncbi:leucine--tRNA ligase [Maribacter cobaltidurans]|uniref:Leucine--tRNA ligase n=1 Tax=Maribacter cobaltidurans TaxID=1178778 RepID=A0A223V6Q7_9FLAO|nr:class I tRNA ligase family protein [Maribacter cobaltidurans]ASV30509.1 leucine--tRNA ligase [Maribacter cobaltidurans]GGD79323.1 leucine--tRNA ligase [Maribacter cobaltidurans]
MNYNFNEIEAKWQKYWAENQTFKAENDSEKEKFYVLDMFPYPSGAGLHVGHPLGYIASDIYARYKRHKGFNVLHPQGYDSFGLPAEQYAIQTGQHPRNTTEINIEGCLDTKGNILSKYVNEDGSIKEVALIDKSKKVSINDNGYRDNIIKGYRRQLDKIGFSFDWSREVRTSDPSYYKWTQWIFIQLFNSWYNIDTDKAEDIESLIQIFEKEGNTTVNAICDDDTPDFTAETWNAFSSKEKQALLLKYRLTYLADTEVNWCPALGTVLANDEIVNGVSERGGHPVIRKKMTQWSMRITAYAQRLLDGLDKIDWPQPLKDSQTNWIGRSEGASVTFKVLNNTVTERSRSDENVISTPLNHPYEIEVFTTRPDTIFGVSFMTLAPEHELVSKITTPEQKDEVEAYIEATAKRSERDRMADVKTITGAFTGAYAEHPFTKERVPIWIGDYVLAGYGTGAVMSVPCGDQRDYDFAKHFDIPIPNIFKGVDISEEAFADKDNTVIANSDFLNGLPYKKAVKHAIFELEKIGQGKGKVNYRLRDAVFSRQRYWGEPFPVYYDADGMPQMIEEQYLPITLPEVEKYLPTETGEPPLGNATEWAWDSLKAEVVNNERIDHKNVFPLELNTMPGWAGSSQYFNRYMDSHNDEEIFSQEAINYWQDVDLYIGGSEHATGHLLYSRFWQKFMFDKGLVPKDEFAKKLINQGMITGTSAFVYGFWVSFSHYNTPQDLEKEDKTRAYPVQPDFLLILSKEKFEIVEQTKDYIEFENWIEQKFSDYKSINGIDKNVSQNVFELTPIALHVDVSLVNASEELNKEGFLNWREEFDNSVFYEEGNYIVGREVEKMSKSKYNVVNPDAICEEYGADSLRLYEMFLGPLEQSKPWNTAGITGVHSFLKKLWRLYHSGPNGEFFVSDTPPSEGSGEAFKTLHKTIKKVEEDIENFSFNTSVSTFMICVNELSAQKCNSRAILEPLAILVSPYAPHIAEELWEKLGHTTSIATAPFPKFEEKYLIESSKEYPISFNGKMRFTMELPMEMTKEEIEAAVMAHEKTQQQLQGRTPKKVIVVPGKIVNIVG